MFFQFTGLDRDYNELNCFILKHLQTGKTIYNCYRHAYGEVLLCVCSAFVFNGTMFDGSTRQARLRSSDEVCSHFMSLFLYKYENLFGHTQYISQIARALFPKLSYAASSVSFLQIPWRRRQNNYKKFLQIPLAQLVGTQATEICNKITAFRSMRQ